MQRSRQKISLFVSCLAGVFFGQASFSSTVQDGESGYRDYCVACHQAGGMGMPGMAPSLQKDSLKTNRKAAAYIVQVMLKGSMGLDTSGFYAAPMPPWGHLKDDELALIANYILTLNELPATVTASLVAELRQVPAAKQELQKLRGGE